MTMQRPSIGRVVHYVSFGSRGGEYPVTCRAAMITDTPERDAGDPEADGAASLCVVNPEGMHFRQNVPYSEEAESGTWHWPERI